jgi:hypothetical protein
MTHRVKNIVKNVIVSCPRSVTEKEYKQKSAKKEGAWAKCGGDWVQASKVLSQWDLHRMHDSSNML